MEVKKYNLNFKESKKLIADNFWELSKPFEIVNVE